MKTVKGNKIKMKFDKAAPEASSFKKRGKSSSTSEDELRTPTLEELNESVKPENTFSIKSIRSKQKIKHEKNLEQKKCKNKLQNKNTFENYLKTWKYDRKNWKYKKLVQMEIVSKMFDENFINNSVWPVVLEYLCGSEGKAKDKIIEKAEKEISSLDEEVEKGERAILKSAKYARARDLIQNLN